jgi:hypothetical protein
MTGAASGDEPSLLLVDGDNLLHHVRGGRDEGGVAWLLPLLVRWRPPHLRIIVTLDGHAAPGDAARRRVAPGIEFLHAGSRSADDLIVELLSAQPFSARDRTIIVTRDRDLLERARRAGGLTRSVAWLMRQLAEPGPVAPALPGARVGIGQGRRGRPAVTAPGSEDEARGAWQPGRGATRKRGNPRRGAKASRRR